MPGYKMKGLGLVFLKGTKLPPPCRTCGDLSSLLCDGDLGGGHTCDAPMCEACATEIGPNRHHCPTCREAARVAQGQRELPLLTEIR